MTDITARLEAIRKFLQEGAITKPEWAGEHREFVCASCVAQVSDLQRADLDGVFEDIFSGAVAAAPTREALQQMVNQKVRYAVSRVPDRDGNFPVTLHIHKDFIWGFGADKEKFGIIKLQKDGFDRAYSAYDIVKAKFGKQSNQSTQLTEIFDEVQRELSAVFGENIAEIIVRRDLCQKDKNGRYFFTEISLPIVATFLNEYQPYSKPLTAMKIDLKFDAAIQSLSYEAVVMQEVIERLAGRRESTTGSRVAG